ncbi:MAG: 50S ribosomal protein L11 methyltransferase [Actinobacteria bacterium]|nr:50S ribosomal protein L11 methyltransferase [Actinomycetota bacterium]MBV8394990.1 50S ribosomal protein L11 methyltransferase [Actinomycetota bacterium]MBV8598664.1 50S ribosomal protein L11 methyltransferase [Actinomycetota bacterium]
MRARFVDLAPDGFEERAVGGGVELAAYGDAAERVREAFAGADVRTVEDGWEDRWREFHHGVRIGALWVGPPWEAAPDDVVAIVVDPGRAFGTGAHPTTRLCLELLADVEPGSLVDVGCGSGVLSIAAVRLGFAPVVAVDVAAAAVEATLANAAANEVELEARVLDALTEPLPAADAVVANIALDAVEVLAPRVEANLLVTSGYLARDTPHLAGFVCVERREREGWAAELHARK